MHNPKTSTKERNKITAFRGKEVVRIKTIVGYGAFTYLLKARITKSEK
jgi:hypothetical protein